MRICGAVARRTVLFLDPDCRLPCPRPTDPHAPAAKASRYESGEFVRHLRTYGDHTARMDVSRHSGLRSGLSVGVQMSICCQRLHHLVNVLTDADFDDFMRWVEDHEHIAVIKALLDPNTGILASGIVVQSIESTIGDIPSP